MIKFKVPWDWLVLRTTDSLDIAIQNVQLPDMPKSVRETFRIEYMIPEITWAFVEDNFEMTWDVYLVFEDEGSASVFKLAYL